MDFIKFVNESPTPYHAVSSVVSHLEAAGYTKLKERDNWDLAPRGKYYVTRNGSSIIAWQLGDEWVPGSPMAIVGAHTDSPTLRLKPKSSIKANGYVELGVEIYGGGMWPTWFDRDLSVAGRVYVKSEGKSQPRLVKVEKPLLRIPTLAIHLHRELSDTLKFNKETHLKPILALEGSANTDDEHPKGLMALLSKQLGIQASQIEDFELILYDTQASTIGGLNDEFIFSGRLDNLNSCWCALQGLTSSSWYGPSARIMALFDHEEVGSVSTQGANSNFLSTVIERINTSGPAVEANLSNITSRATAQSFLLSADMAHAVHPNYIEKHESQHRPLINGGPVIKTNASQKYATNSVGNVLLYQIADIAKVPLQKFVVRNDSSCGSTIGPMLSARLGIRTLDIGNPQLSMHSIREMGGVQDLYYSIELFKAFYSHYATVEKSIEID